jgi:hypothetical protein
MYIWIRLLLACVMQCAGCGIMSYVSQSLEVFVTETRILLSHNVGNIPRIFHSGFTSVEMCKTGVRAIEGG